MSPVFAKPEYLLIGVLVTALLGALFYFSEKRAWSRLFAFAENTLLDRLTRSHSRKRLWVKNALLMTVVLSLFVALARPQWGAHWEKSETRGIDIMIALDTSRSMLAEDISPNRLERSKLAILDLLASIKGDRIGLIAFAGNAFLQCPLTLDYQAFRHTLSAVDTDTIPIGGTDVAAAIDEADAYFEESGNERILILITDGEDLEATGLARARASAEKGMRILTVGVGSAKGELIPIRNAMGEVDYLRDASGKPVSTSLDEQTLRQIASISNGLYAPLGPAGGGLDEVYQFCLSQMPAEEREESLQRIPIERFQWILVLAIFLLIVETLVTTRRAKPTGAPGMSALFIGLAGIGVSMSFPTEGFAGVATEASKAFKEDRFEESVTLYREARIADPNNPKFAYNMGVSEYRSGRFQEAIGTFEEALRLAQPGLQEKIFHNMGNSRVALGFNNLDEEPALTRDQWNAAITDFQNALSLDPDRANSRTNLEQVRQVIADHTYSLTTQANPVIGGTVTEGTRIFHNIPVTIEAKPHDGYIFSTWEGEGIESPENATTTIRLQEDTTAVAQFVKTWKLTVLSDDESMGTAGTSGTYREDEPVTIKAEAIDYFAFSKWKSDDVQIADPTQAETELTLTSDTVVTATFVPAFKLSVEIDPVIGGQAGPSGFFEEYSMQPIQAQPRPGFEWVEWIGDGIEDTSAQQTTIGLTEDRLAIAKVKRIWNLVIVPDPEEGGSTEGAGNHPVGSTVEISATPNEGFTFEGWEGPGVVDPASPQTQVTVESTEHTLFAHFKQDEQDDQDQDQDQENQDQDQENQDQQDQEEDNSDSEDNQDQEQEQPEEQEPEDEQEQDGQPDQPEEQEQQEQPAPGEMSREEARQLLNALSESEKFLPAGEISEEKNQTSTPTGRDW
jgi:Ca-activated chloride channel family protein